MSANNYENQLTGIFFPAAIETAGSWSWQAVELVQEIGRCISEAVRDKSRAELSALTVKLC